MSVVRSPVRSVVRSPVRSVLGSGALSSSNLQQLLALSPSLLIWPSKGSGWQGTSGGTLSATGQPVGLLPDLAQFGGKTQAAWLASPTTPEVITNGGFDSDTSWLKGTGWTISGGVAQRTNTGTVTNIVQVSPGLVDGKVYRIQMDVTLAGGSLTVLCGTSTTSPSITASGSYEFALRASGTLNFVVTAAAAFEGTIDNISIKELPGNHLRAGTWASPADSSRALYGRVPLGGRRNSSLHTEAITAANGWNNSYVSNGTRTDGALSLTTNEGFVYFRRNGNAVPGTPNTVSFDAVCDTTVNNVPFRTSSGSSATTLLVNMVAGVSQRITLPAFTPASTQFEIGIDARNAIVPGGSNETGYIVTFNKIQTEVGSSATAYQKVTDQYDVTEAGVADTYYLDHDGVDDQYSLLNSTGVTDGTLCIVDNSGVYFQDFRDSGDYRAPDINLEALAIYPTVLTAGERATVASAFGRSSHTYADVLLALNGQTSSNLRLDTSDASAWAIDWGDGTTATPASEALATRTYASAYTGLVRATATANITRLDQTTGRAALGAGQVPATVTILSVTASNTLSGNVSDLPTGLTILNVRGSNTLSGNVSTLPTGLAYLYMTGYNTLSGNVSDLPTGLAYLSVTGSNTLSVSSATSWRTASMRAVLTYSALTSTEVDDLLIAMATVTSWTNEKEIQLNGGGNAARTAASDAAVSTIEGYGVTVVTAP